MNSHGIPFFYNRFEVRLFECCHHTLWISTLLSGLMRGILRFIFFICRHEKFSLFLRTFVCISGLLLPDSTILLAVTFAKICTVCQNSELLLRYSDILRWAQGRVFTPYVKLLHFSVLGKVLCVIFLKFSIL